MKKQLSKVIDPKLLNNFLRSSQNYGPQIDYNEKATCLTSTACRFSHEIDLLGKATIYKQKFIELQETTMMYRKENLQLRKQCEN